MQNRTPLAHQRIWGASGGIVAAPTSPSHSCVRVGGTPALEDVVGRKARTLRNLSALSSDSQSCHLECRVLPSLTIHHCPCKNPF